MVRPEYVSRLSWSGLAGRGERGQGVMGRNVLACGDAEKNSSMDPHSTALAPHATARAVPCGGPPFACVAGKRLTAC